MSCHAVQGRRHAAGGDKGTCPRLAVSTALCTASWLLTAASGLGWSRWRAAPAGARRQKGNVRGPGCPPEGQPGAGALGPLGPRGRRRSGLSWRLHLAVIVRPAPSG